MSYYPPLIAAPYARPPLASAFTQYNAGGRTTTLTDDRGALKMSYADGTTGYDCRVAIKAIAAAPYTWTALIRSVTYADTQLFGLALRQSSNGSIETFEIASSGTMANNVWSYHNATASNTTQSPTYTQNATGGLGGITAHEASNLWMQIYDDNTNRIYRVSSDGISWKTLRTISRTNFITPDQIGVMIFNSTASNAGQSVSFWSLG